MKAFKSLVALLALLYAVSASADPVPEQDYTVLPQAQPTHSGNKIEVLEFFFYGCSHCLHLHPALAAWDKQKPKDVEITYVPTVFNPNWEPMALTFYSLEAMGKLKQLDDALYDAWAANNILVEVDQIADFVAKHGVDRQKFNDFYGSFAIQSRVTRSKQMQLSYHISGTPTLIVDGKYMIVNKLQAADTIRVLNDVIAMARKARGGKR